MPPRAGAAFLAEHDSHGPAPDLERDRALRRQDPGLDVGDAFPINLDAALLNLAGRVARRRGQAGFGHQFRQADRPVVHGDADFLEVAGRELATRKAGLERLGGARGLQFDRGSPR